MSRVDCGSPVIRNLLKQQAQLNLSLKEGWELVEKPESSLGDLMKKKKKNRLEAIGLQNKKSKRKQG